MLFSNSAHFLASALPLRENWSISLCKLVLNCSSVSLVRPVPMIENCLGNHPSKNRLYNAGAILREFKSPVPPNMMKMVGSDFVLLLMINVFLELDAGARCGD